MKRGFVTLLLLILLVSPIVLAANDTTEETDILQKNITIPSFEFLYLIQVPGYSFTFTWIELILYIIVATFLFITVLEILSFTTFETAWVKALIAGAITILIGIFGIFRLIIDFFYNAMDNFKIIAWGVIILLIASLLIKPIMNGIRKGKRLSKSEELGTKAGAVLKGLNKMAETSAKTNP